MRGASRLAVVVGREEGASSPVDGVASDEAGFREGGERSAARRRSERFPRVRGARRRELLRFFPVERARLERASEAASDPLAHAVSLGIGKFVLITTFLMPFCTQMCWIGDSYGGLIVCMWGVHCILIMCVIFSRLMDLHSAFYTH